MKMRLRGPAVLAALAFACFLQPSAAFSQSPDNPALSLPAVQPPQIQTQLQVPSPETMTVLIKMALAGLNQANRTNNYSVVWALGSDTFRKVNSPETMSKNFAGLRNARVDLSGMILLTPQLLQLPVIEQGKYLHLRGYFQTQPARIDFDLAFEPSQGQWKLASLGVDAQLPQYQAPPVARGSGQ